MAMRHIVLDTNCLLQVLPSHSPYHKIWTEVLAGRISLCVNTEILNEYEEILSVHALPEVAQNVLTLSPVTLRPFSVSPISAFTCCQT